MLTHSASLDRPAVGTLDLRTEILEVGRRWSSAQYLLVHLSAQLDRSGEWALDGSRTCAHWLADAFDVEVCTSREWVRIGHQLSDLPIIDGAFATGRVSFTKVRQLTRVANAANEAELTSIAERTRAGRLAAAIAAWLAGHEQPDETERRHHAARGLTWRVEPDGMVTGTLRSPPETAAVLSAAVDTWILGHPVSTTERGADATTVAPMPPSVTAKREWPTVAQQRADALVALLVGGGTNVTTEVVLHVRADGCTLDDGTPIAGTVVERIAPDSFIRLLIHDAERRPINASGRHRHPTRRQKRVVHERDQGCVDCGATSLLQHDHDPDFDLSKRTLVDQLRERCWTCHRARHARKGASP